MSVMRHLFRGQPDKLDLQLLNGGSKSGELFSQMALASLGTAQWHAALKVLERICDCCVAVLYAACAGHQLLWYGARGG